MNNNERIYRYMNRCRDSQDQAYDADEQAGDAHREEKEESAEESFKDVIDDVLDATGKRLRKQSGVRGVLEGFDVVTNVVPGNFNVL